MKPKNPSQPKMVSSSTTGAGNDSDDDPMGRIPTSSNQIDSKKPKMKEVSITAG
jgi:hypothetical protein